MYACHKTFQFSRIAWLNFSAAIIFNTIFRCRKRIDRPPPENNVPINFNQENVDLITIPLDVILYKYCTQDI